MELMVGLYAIMISVTLLMVPKISAIIPMVTSTAFRTVIQMVNIVPVSGKLYNHRHNDAEQRETEGTNKPNEWTNC